MIDAPDIPGYAANLSCDRNKRAVQILVELTPMAYVSAHWSTSRLPARPHRRAPNYLLREYIDEQCQHVPSLNAARPTSHHAAFYRYPQPLQALKRVRRRLSWS